MFLEGLLGGVMGGSNAVNELSGERRKLLAEKLKMDAMEEIQMRSDTRRFGHEKGLQQENIKAEDSRATKKMESTERISEKETSSREKISSERNATLERIANMENEIKEKMHSAQMGSNEAQVMRAKVAALAEARKVIENGGTTEEANAVLETVGLPPFEEYVMDEGSEGILGFGKKEPVIGRRLSGGKSQTGGTQTGGGLSSELQALLEEGKGSSGQGKPQSDGIVNDAMADNKPGTPDSINPKLPPDVKSWNVKEKVVNGRTVPVAEIDGEQIELSQYEYVYWMTNKDKQQTATIDDVMRGLTNRKIREQDQPKKGERTGIPTY